MKTPQESARFSSVIGEPTLESYQAARELERNCRLSSGPHTFHLTIDVRPRPTPAIRWAHNADLHFGITRPSLSDYHDLIKPEWRNIYCKFGLAAYKIAQKQLPLLRPDSASYTVKVPLRQMDGGYYWYNQVARACEFDKRGNMVAHLNSYHRLAPYDRLLPDQPIVTVNERKHPAFQREIQRAGSQALTALLFNGLRPREFEVLYLYRRFAANPRNQGKHLNSQQLAKKMGIQIHGINKHNTRVLTAARSAFPASRFTTVAELAEFLNVLFGPPAKP